MRVIKKAYPNPHDVTVAELGCAQANTSLLLAEAGYNVLAIDITSTDLEYSRKKYEKGDIEWINADISHLCLRLGTVDIVILGEVVEHCAYPEIIVAIALEHLREGGFVLVTTPNGSRIKPSRPTFSHVLERTQRNALEKTQFGAVGRSHLFLFTLAELCSITPASGRIVGKGYFGGTVLINAYSYGLCRLLPLQIIEAAIRVLSRIPILNRTTYNNIFVMIRKGSSDHRRHLWCACR